jgi:hypothetical protein
VVHFRVESAQPSTFLDEFEDVKKVENSYRAYYAIPLRKSWDGFDIPLEKNEGW